MGPRDLYALFGLNDAEIELIKTGVRSGITTPPARKAAACSS